jgi:pimeloyl-ACP methyl ester carboxylesterase
VAQALHTMRFRGMNTFRSWGGGLRCLAGTCGMLGTLAATRQTPVISARREPAPKEASARIVWSRDTTVAITSAWLVGAAMSSQDSLCGASADGSPFPGRPDRAPASSTPARRQEPTPPFPYRAEDVAFASEGEVRLAGTITTPLGAGPFPSVVLVAGSGPQDRDAKLAGHRPFLVLADYLARRGIASLRYDKRGVALSTGDFTASASADFAADAEAAVRFLQGRPGMARGRVGIIGHSEGGLIAPVVAARSRDVAFIVLLAGPGIPGDSGMQLQRRATIALASGTTRVMLQRGLEANRLMFAAMRAARDSADMATRLIAAQVETVGRLPADERGEANRQLDVKRALLLSPWWRSFILYDPRPTLRKLEVPVLALNGTLDLQVTCSPNLSEIAAALRSGGNRDYRVVAMPGLNHLFQTTTTGDPAEYEKNAESFAPAALDLIATWIRARAGSTP